MGVFATKTGKNGKFYFNLKATNGQVILTSQGYESMDGCDNGIASVQKNALEKNNFEVKEAKDGSPYFVLKAGNGQVIGNSEMYKSMASCQNGIASVMKNAPDAPTKPE